MEIYMRALTKYANHVLLEKQISALDTFIKQYLTSPQVHRIACYMWQACTINNREQTGEAPRSPNTINDRDKQIWCCSPGGASGLAKFCWGVAYCMKNDLSSSEQPRNSLEQRPSMLFLMSPGVGVKRCLTCSITLAISAFWCRVLASFIMRTTAASSSPLRSTSTSDLVLWRSLTLSTRDATGCSLTLRPQINFYLSLTLWLCQRNWLCVQYREANTPDELLIEFFWRRERKFKVFFAKTQRLQN